MLSYLLPVLLWGSLIASTLVLLVLMRTEWGRERPTHRYVMLSIVGHLLIICIATTIRFAVSPKGDGPAPVKVRIVMRTPPSETPLDNQPQPVTPREENKVEEPTPAEPQPSETQPEPAEQPEPLEPPTPVAEQPTAEPPEPPEQVVEPPAPAPPAPTPDLEPLTNPQPPVQSIDPPTASQPALEPLQPLPAAQQPIAAQPVKLEPAPTAFTPRDGDQRLRLIQEEGGDAMTEDAVAMALAWLASAQSPDGRWDADRWSAGRENGSVLGHNRTGVGQRADTAVTSLALLTIMGAGHTHQEGPFAESLNSGLAYLIRTQAADGNLFGDASLFAQTYCHSMATFALAEALAVSDDRRLEPAVRRAVNYLLSRQDRSGGGWRYRSGRPGDMSQMGWIVMALRSAELAGIQIPATAWDGIERFVRSNQRGAQGGLSSYLPGSAPSHSMTAESFYCRQILGRPIPAPTANESVDAILQQAPGRGKKNLYAWYYGTLSLHHHRRASGAADHAWRQWNDALKRRLVTDQVPEGVNKGSWSPNSVWGRCGGRVYSTALATMCLEVYYRYDPNQLVRDPWIAARGQPNKLR